MRRYALIEYAPPGESELPALTVGHYPVFSGGLTTPALSVIAGEFSQGDALLIEKLSQTGYYLAGAYRGDDYVWIDGNGNGWFSGYVASDQYLQLLETGSDPPTLLIDSSQIWNSDGHRGNAGDLLIQAHQGGDPGTDKIHKMIDYTYGPFFGEEVTPSVAAIINLTAGSYNQITLTLDRDVTFNITGGTEGQRLYFVLTEDGTGGWTVTFNNNFNSAGPRTAGANAKICLEFIYHDGDSEWVEVTGGTVGGGGGPAYGEAFTWIFKLVDATDFATPEPGLTPVVQISKDGAAFAGLTGAPAFAEIGSAWYKITAPAVDMTANTVVFKAIDAGNSAQTDETFYLT